jgi:hypothetical protein
MLKVHWSEAKEKFEALMDAAVKGETVIIMGENEQDVHLIVKPKQRVFGSGADGILYMSDDFDEPLEDFQEYME